MKGHPELTAPPKKDECKKGVSKPYMGGRASQVKWGKEKGIYCKKHEVGKVCHQGQGRSSRKNTKKDQGTREKKE